MGEGHFQTADYIKYMTDVFKRQGLVAAVVEVQGQDRSFVDLTAIYKVAEIVDGDPNNLREAVTTRPRFDDQEWESFMKSARDYIDSNSFDGLVKAQEKYNIRQLFKKQAAL